MPPQNQPPQPGQPASYDFIMNPAPPPKKPLLPAADSMIKRIGLFAVGAIVLLIVLVALKGLLVGKPKLDSMVTVAQDQQEIIHLTTNASQQQNLSSDNKNMIATVQLSVSSAQSQIITYLATNHLKTNIKTLNLGINNSLDQQLTNAATSGTYNQSLQDTMKTQLNNYIGDLQQAFNQIKGKKGRALLSSDYNQAQLLMDQLNAASSSSP